MYSRNLFVLDFVRKTPRVHTDLKEDEFMLAKGFSKPTDRVERLRSMIVNAVPCIEAERAVLITESYKATEGLPMIMRRAKALENILNNLTVTIRDDELVVGTLTKAVRSCQLFPENSYKSVSYTHLLYYYFEPKSRENSLTTNLRD